MSLRAEAQLAKWAAPADGYADAVYLFMAGFIHRSTPELAIVWANIDIPVAVIHKSAGREHPAAGAPFHILGRHICQVIHLLVDLRAVVAPVQPDLPDTEAEPADLTLYAVGIGLEIVDISGRDEHVCDDAAFAVDTPA